MKKVYTNFRDIDRDLEILKLEREIQLRKLGMKLENSSDLVSPNNLMKTGVSSLTSVLKSSSGLKSVIITGLIRFIINKFIKK